MYMNNYIYFTFVRSIKFFFLPCLDAVKMRAQIWSHLYSCSDIDFDDVDYYKHYYSHLIKQIIVHEYDVLLSAYYQES